MSRLATTLTIAFVLACGLATTARADLASNLGALEGDNLKGYLGPLPKAMSTTLNSGIFQTGKVPKAGFQFSFGIAVTGATFEDADRTFTPTDPFGFTATTPTVVPTIVGDRNAVAVPNTGGGTALYPGGLDISQFTLPVPQVTIGSVFGTRATVRWFGMKFDNSDIGKIDFLGIGVQHSLSQYLPNLPVDLALGGMYQTLKLGDGLLDTKSTHVDVTASKSFGKLVRVEPYVSVGYDKFDLSAAYTYKGSSTATVANGDKVSVTFDTISNKHLTAGVRLSLVVVKIYAEVVSAANNGASVGLTFGS